MVNRLLKILFGRELILYNSHRNSDPLLIEPNLNKYFFFDPRLIWKLTAIVGRRSHLRFKLIYGILTILNPVYIIDINWLGKLQSTYLVWCNNNKRSFIVIQHGIYYAGVMRFIPEKYVKCNVFLVWGDYFKQMHEKNNPGKEFRCITFGNTCYNQYERSSFSYKNRVGNSVLVALSVIKGTRLEQLYELLSKLREYGFNVTVKEHAYQAKQSEPITGYPKVTGSLYEMLQKQEFDIVITDVSSAMLDIIFFKNRAIYFSPEEEGSDLNDNVYADFMKNLANEMGGITKREELLEYVNINAQESLLTYLVKTENSSNDLEQLKEMANEETEFTPKQQKYVGLPK